jgi:hypothetical protein
MRKERRMIRIRGEGIRYDFIEVNLSGEFGT